MTPDLSHLRDLVRALAADLASGVPASAGAPEAVRTRVALALPLTYLAVFTGRVDLAIEQERAVQRLAGGAAPSAPDLGRLAADTERSYAALAEFARRWPAHPPAHGVAASRVAALYGVLGVPEADASRRAVRVADLVNAHVFTPYWRG